MTNVLTAIRTIINHPISDLVNYYQSKNRINQMGKALKCFIKDIFADTDLSDFKYNSNFSFHCIIKKEKYYSFPRLDIESLERFKLLENFKIMDIDIKSPNNPGDLLPARLISFWND
jgi:hypothetical protein